MNKDLSNTHIAVIGAGPGGYTAAFKAADMGFKVTLIDHENNPGGVCLYRGCIPSKALLHVAKLINESKAAKNWGIQFGKPEIDLEKLQTWKEKVVKKLVAGLGHLCRTRKIHYIKGNARFIDSQTLVIDKDAEPETLTVDYSILATGSRPSLIPSLQINDPRVMDSTIALDLTDIPDSLLIIGGGYIGLEIGSVYAALGSKVSLVEMSPGLLLSADRDLVAVLEKQLQQQFENIWLNTKVSSLNKDNNTIAVTLEGEITAEKTFAKVLIAVGRQPNTKDLGLEKTKIVSDNKGFINVDSQRRSEDAKIFAIGDVTGEPMLAHKASHEAIAAVESIAAGTASAFDPQAIPAVVFTDPELAFCGLSETEAKEKNIKIEVARFPWSASGRASTVDRNDGLTKLIIDATSKRILGMGICGSGAGELIAEGVLAVEMAAVASDLSLSIHPHPTLSETIMEAAELFSGSSTHIYKPKRS